MTGQLQLQLHLHLYLHLQGHGVGPAVTRLSGKVVATEVKDSGAWFSSSPILCLSNYPGGGYPPPGHVMQERCDA